MEVVDERLVDNDLALGVEQSKLATIVPRNLSFIYRLLRETVLLRIASAAILAFNEFSRGFLCWVLLYWILRLIHRLITQVALNHPLYDISYQDRLTTSHWVIILYIMHFKLVLINSA
jgi:hypothetical protein